MTIQIEPHTLQRALERGASEDEIKETLNNGINLIAKQGRFAKSKVFRFGKERNGRFYEEKRVDVYFIIENEIIITVTVYVYYGKF